MSTAEDEIARRIVRRLDRGLPDLDGQTLARLRSARASALEGLEHAPALAMAPAGRGSRSLAHGHAFLMRRLASVALLVAAISGMVYWQQMQHEEPVDIDAKLLSGDLPIDAYLDKGLDAWLNR